jgi:hypothetical protein
MDQSHTYYRKLACNTTEAGGKAEAHGTRVMSQRRLAHTAEREHVESTYKT